MRHVIKHFAAAREKLKGNERSPFDFTLRDLVSRLNNLVDIHWLCVVNSLLNEKLKEKEDDVYKVMSSIFKKFQDFDTFWSALSMPHNDCEDDRFQANDLISNELKELRDDINNVSELPETLKEDKKFFSFLKKQNLVSYAKSLNFKQYCRKFLMLSKINVDIREWEKYINKIGITAVRRKKSVDYFCVKYMYYLDNKYLVGRKVRSENGGEGSLGYAFCKDKNIYHITSLHILVDGTLFKKMNTSLNQVLDIENQCKIEGIGNAVIRKGVYSKGDSQSAGVEIVLVDTSSVLYVPSNSSSDPTAHHTVPVPPRQTKSKGSVHPLFDKSVGATGSGLPQFDTPVTGATGSDLPQFDTIKMGSTRPASFDTDSNIEGTYLYTPVIDGSIFPPIGQRYYQLKCHDLPNRLYFEGNKMVGNVIDLEVYILGAVTGLVKGKIIQTGCTFEFYNLSVDKKKTFFDTLKFIFTKSEQQKPTKSEPPKPVSLKNQYKVEWDPLGFPFSKEGDSGAAVFHVNKETGELTAVGILTGNNATLGVSYVTPIKDILHILQANGLNYELGHFKLCLGEQDKDVQQKLYSDLCREVDMV
ncbi:uncharacterized protein LOC132723651 [Ruditapes philippinarum]|uniref:uncharacterized protein LOC132723651 n=1 Tax=Ruditapes philippinarum TaxID=129788 RepID=UPI00295B4A41|nr:uncharacterized protein LOC132723651 [Ruditapes philippinarum]